MEAPPTWYPVMKLARLKRESRLVWESPTGVTLLLCWVAPEVYAVSAHCPHQHFSLLKGRLDPENLSLECPLHHWTFSLRNGQGLNQSSCLAWYPTRQDSGQVWVADQPLKTVL